MRKPICRGWSGTMCVWTSKPFRLMSLASSYGFMRGSRRSLHTTIPRNRKWCFRFTRGNKEVDGKRLERISHVLLPLVLDVLWCVDRSTFSSTHNRLIIHEQDLNESQQRRKRLIMLNLWTLADDIRVWLSVLCNMRASISHFLVTIRDMQSK